MNETSIRNVIAGDNFQIVRAVSNLPSGESAVKAWFTVKTKFNQTDAGSELQKTISEDDTPGTGFIENSSPLAYATLRFDIAGADWDTIVAGKLYRYDIKLKTSSGGIYTVENGTFLADEQVTKASE